MNRSASKSSGPAAVRRAIPLAIAAFFALFALAFTASTANAQATSLHTVTWLHSAPAELTGFVIFVSPVAGTVPETRQIDVGLPTGAPAGDDQLYTATIDALPSDFIAVTAVSAGGGTSSPSRWSGLPPTVPGQPLIVSP